MSRVIGICLAIAIGLGGFSYPAVAEQGAEVKTAKIVREGYKYEPAGRRDPFLSILDAAAQTKAKRAKGLIPLQDYDLSQVRLIAIVWDTSERYALVGLPDGKFYTVKEKMTIGIHEGEIHRIMEDAVLVREFKPDFKGTLRAQDTVLRLRKEGR